MDPVEREPMWLVHKVDQRLAFLREQSGGIEAMAIANGAKIIMTFLSDPEDESDEAQERWNHSCDNCGGFGHQNPGYVMRQVGAIQVVLTFGMCDTCKDMP
jgi:hypothetical protein